MSRFTGKIALVTGASSGMGAATADQLAREGARVFTAQRGASAHETIEVDLLEPDAPQVVIDEITAKTGGLDILINNAGVMCEGTVEETSLQDWDQQIALNLTVPFMLTRLAMPLLRDGGGTIVNIGSIEGLGSNPRHPAYCASKAGLHGLTRTVAVDHGSDGVRCNAVYGTIAGDVFATSPQIYRKFHFKMIIRRTLRVCDHRPACFHCRG